MKSLKENSIEFTISPLPNTGSDGCKEEWLRQLSLRGGLASRLKKIENHLGRTFIILCHFLKTVAGLSSTKIVDVEEMVAMFLHVLAHDVKYRNCLGALDETYIKVNVPVADHPTFRTRKGEITTNVLCGFLASYRGQRYHLQECRGAGNAVTNAKVYFNMKHSLIRNMIECAFGVRKSFLSRKCGIVKLLTHSMYFLSFGIINMTTSSRAPKHVWTKKEEDSLVECSVELVSIGGWKSNNSTFWPAKGLLNKPFSYYEELAYVLGRDRETGCFTVTFVDVKSNESVRYEGFDMSDGNDEFPSMYSQ
ncbi:retrotransposon protein [Cucumis melo var. makuwa]|uniref:Retrotransposon protein n=1 Tax=Cucumis melo var. makuwa TaxID=1194695 RepID=A0A5D3DGS4_CUCMM|nr:retrotransposon protein [Cucumis melo var. makuwa]